VGASFLIRLFFAYLFRASFLRHIGYCSVYKESSVRLVGDCRRQSRLLKLWARECRAVARGLECSTATDDVSRQVGHHQLDQAIPTDLQLSLSSQACVANTSLKSPLRFLLSHVRASIVASSIQLYTQRLDRPPVVADIGYHVNKNFYTGMRNDSRCSRLAQNTITIPAIHTSNRLSLPVFHCCATDQASSHPRPMPCLGTMATSFVFRSLLSYYCLSCHIHILLQYVSQCKSDTILS